MSSYQHLRYEVDGPVAVITIDRPKALNALNAETLDELEQVLDELASPLAEPRGVILTGAGERAFVAGADITELQAATGKADLARGLARRGQRVLRKIAGCRKPVVACVNGYALGGGLELALACHFRYAQASAKLGLPEVTLGLIPGYGGTQRLSRLVGRGPAAELILTGAPIDAQEALRIGLVNRVFESKDAMLDAARQTLTAMAEKTGPLAVGLALEALDRGLELAQDGGLEVEADLFGVAMASEDGAEGTRAFVEKRKPSFKGR